MLAFFSIPSVAEESGGASSISLAALISRGGLYEARIAYPADKS